MKKSLVALATLSVVGTAFADVDVSGGIKLYGVLDQAYTSQTLTAPIASGSTVTYNSMFASSATSRLGVKGSRDLGDGIKGRVQAEIQIEPDNKSLLPADKNRTGFVALSKEGAGEVQLGTQETTAYEVFGMDVNGRVEYKPQVWRTTASNNIQDRANNAIKYISPEFGGLTFHAQKGFSDTTISTSNVFTSLGLKFNQDKFKAAFVYDKLTNSTAKYLFAGTINAGPSAEGSTRTRSMNHSRCPRSMSLMISSMSVQLSSKLSRGFKSS
jgi:predicted porin